MNPLAILISAAASVLLLTLPRKYAVLPLFVCAYFLTIDQRIVIAGLDFTVVRILILVGFLRVLKNSEANLTKLGSIDLLMIAWVIVMLVTYTVLYRSVSAFVYRLGTGYTVLGLYFLYRFLIRTEEEFLTAIKILAILSIPLVLLMLVEARTGRNLFFVFGGVPQFSVVRDGRIRCQGPFRHSIMAGTFGATMVPLVLALWRDDRFMKRIVIAGLLAFTGITVCSSSSGPLVAYGAAVFALSMWYFRKHLRILLWGGAALLLVLHFAMKAPVWYLIARLSSMVGGGGYHRSKLIDQAINHFSEWWMIGTTYTAHWMPYALPSNPRMADMTNEYIRIGINGGLISMILFLAILGTCFHQLGKTSPLTPGVPAHSREWLTWCLGSALFSHCVSFISVSYLDQTVVFFYLLLAGIATLTADNSAEWVPDDCAS